MSKDKKKLISPFIDEMCVNLGFVKQKGEIYTLTYNGEFTDRLVFSYSYFGSKEFVYVSLAYGVNNSKLMELYKRLWEYEGEIVPSMIGINSWKGNNQNNFFWDVSHDTDINSVIADMKQNICSKGQKFFDEFHDWNHLCDMIINGKVHCSDAPGYGACALYLNGKKEEAINYYEGKIRKAREKLEKLGRKLREIEYQPFRDNLKKLP